MFKNLGLIGRKQNPHTAAGRNIWFVWKATPDLNFGNVGLENEHIGSPNLYCRPL
jgi:hypothetical protein